MCRYVVLVLLLASCNKGDLYRACEAADDCEAPEAFEPECLEKGGEGFCTWDCSIDADCDDADDEDFDFVCAPFESTGGMHCFPACAEGEEDDEVCPRDMSCRSTGGGNDNRKVCFPSES